MANHTNPYTDQSTKGALLDRYARLQELKLRTDADLTSVEAGLRMSGLLSRHGRPEKSPTHTVQQCRDAHAAWQRGDRDEWTTMGERQYQRERKREERARRASPPPGTLDWVCSECSLPINDGEGSLWINASEHWAYIDGMQEWRREHPKDRAHTIGEILKQPGHVRWHSTHRECSSDEDKEYWLAVEKVRTPAQLLATTAHLMGKNWLGDTDWASILDLAARSQS